MTREHARELIPAFVVDALDAEDRRQVEAILAVDPAAAQACDRLSELFDLVADDEVEAEPGGWDSLQARLGERAGVVSEAIEAEGGAEHSGVGVSAIPEALPVLLDGRYLLLEEVARGGVGVVYRARDQETEAVVAVKVYHHRAVTPRLKALFERELGAQLDLDHPNLVACRGWGLVDGLPYSVYPFLERGASLDLSRGHRAWDPAEAVRLVSLAGRGLAAAHQRGLVHRDLKPENLWVEPDGGVRVLGFDTALDVGASDSRLTCCGAAIGVPYYLSPEVIRGKTRQVDGRADVYALGLILYELLTGELAFRRANAYEVFRAKLEGLDDPLERAPGLPQAYRDVLGKALALEPDDRYPDIETFLAELEAVGRGERVAPAAVPPWKVPKRSRAWLWAVVLVALVALCAWWIRRLG